MGADALPQQPSETVEVAFGHVLRDVRKSYGISQEELGLRSGCHRTYISLLERGRKGPSLQTILKLAEAMQTDSAEMVRLVVERLSASSTNR